MTTLRTDQVACGSDGAMDVHIWTPDAAPRSAILVIQEIFGVGTYIRAVAQRLADAGYLVGAPDVFWRFAPNWESDHTEAGLARIAREGSATRLPAGDRRLQRGAGSPGRPTRHRRGAGCDRVLPGWHDRLGRGGQRRAELLCQLLRLRRPVDAGNDRPGVVSDAVPLRQQRFVHPRRRHRRDRRGHRRAARASN